MGKVIPLIGEFAIDVLQLRCHNRLEFRSSRVNHLPGCAAMNRMSA